MLWVWLTLVLLILLNIKRIGWEAYKLYPSPKIAQLPGIPKGEADDIFRKQPRDDAVEELLELSNGGREAGLFQMVLWARPIVMITELKLLKEVLLDDVGYPKSEMLPLVKATFGDAVFFTNGEVSFAHRRMLNDAFKQTKYNHVIQDNFSLLSGHLEGLLGDDQEKVVPVDDLIGKAVFRTMGQFAYGKEYEVFKTDDQEASQYYSAYFKLVSIVAVPTLLLHVLKLHPDTVKSLPFYHQYHTNIKAIHQAIYKIIQERRDLIGEAGIEAAGDDVLGRVLTSNPDYSDKSLMEDLLSLYFAGHDTTAAAITFTIYGVDTKLNGEDQDVIRQESIKFQQWLQENPEAIHDLTQASIIEKLPNLYLAVLEGLRLYPPASGTLARRVTRDGGITLSNGITIPKGFSVLGSLVTCNRDPKLWGSDAMEFKPKRFLASDDALDMDRVRDVMTFGFGPRVCVGKRFGIIQTMLGASKLLSQFKFSLPMDSPHIIKPKVRTMTAITSPVELSFIVSRLEQEK